MGTQFKHNNYCCNGTKRATTETKQIAAPTKNEFGGKEQTA